MKIFKRVFGIMLACMLTISMMTSIVLPVSAVEEGDNTSSVTDSDVSICDEHVEEDVILIEPTLHATGLKNVVCAVCDTVLAENIAVDYLVYEYTAANTDWIFTYSDGVAVSNTVRYSVATYVARIQSNSNTRLVTLVNAMLTYGDAAYNSK